MGSAMRSDQTTVLSIRRGVCLCVNAFMDACDCVLGSGCESKNGFGVSECICMQICICLGVLPF